MSGSSLAASVLLSVVLVLGGAGATDAGAAPPAHAGSRWLWPTSPPGAVVQPYEAPAGPYAAGHRGIDVAAVAGTAVLAPAPGKVVFAGVVVDRPVVTIETGDGVLLSMEPVITDAVVGAAVAAGERVGSVARGGHCDGRCLHLGVRVDGQYVSPMLYFATVPAAVLLPVD